MATDQKLESLSRQAVNDYEELLQKYNKLVDEHSRTKEDLAKLEKVWEPMYDEYGQIKTKYQVEKSMRLAAESYATKVVKDNKKIKRQSNMLLQHMTLKAIPVEINIDDIDETSSDQDKRIEELNVSLSSEMEALQTELAKYKVELRKKTDENELLSAKIDELTSEYGDLKAEYLRSLKTQQEKEASFLQSERELKSLKRVSGLAYTEYHTLQERYETEKALRLKAEAYASERATRHAQKRKSAAMFFEGRITIELVRKRNSIAEQKRSSLPDEHDDEDTAEIKGILEENERLQSQLTELEAEYKAKIEDLQQELKDSSSHDAMQQMKDKLSVMAEEVDRLTSDLQTSNSLKEALQSKVEQLENQAKSSLIPVPPPPPPPPPPGPPAGIFKTLTDIIKDTKTKQKEKMQKIVGKDATANPAMSGAIQEMMERIKKGKGLKPVDITDRPADLQPSDGSEAMEQMHKILQSMKKRNLSDRRPKNSDLPPDSELAQKLSARLDKSESVDKMDDQLANESPSKPQPAARLSQTSGTLNPPVPQPRRPSPPSRSYGSEVPPSELDNVLSRRLKLIREESETDSST